MFGLLNTRTHDDDALGTLVRSWGQWRGTIEFAGAKAVPLSLTGSRTAPDPQALIAARALPTTYAKLRRAIAEHLFEHCEPYLDQLRSERTAAQQEGILGIKTAMDTLDFVKPRAIAIKPVAGVLTTEIALLTAWDEEHTLGFYLAGDRLVEFVASI